MSSQGQDETQVRVADSQNQKGEGRTLLETQEAEALPRTQKGGDRGMSETHPTSVPSPEHDWVGPDRIEVRDHHADSEVSAVCGRLTALSRRRTRIIQRERYVNQPSEQEYAAGILERLPEDHGWNKKKLYVHAMKLRKIALKTDDLTTLTGRNGDLPDADLAVILEQIGTIDEERDYLKSLGLARKKLEKEIERLAKQLPVHEWWVSIRGCGSGGLGKLIGETGDLSNYENPGKVWKRLGLAPFKGKACSQHRRAGGLTAEEWKAAGYNPRRRSAMYTLGDALVKNGDEYRQIFMDRKRREIEKAGEDGRIIATKTKSTVDGWTANGLEGIKLVKQYDHKIHRTAGHIDMRARRYMEKRLVRNLWKEWMRS